jgi:5-methylcytosine-specific restriction endonuclease McrA
MNYKGGKIKKICQICNKDYYVFPYREKSTKCCSMECQGKLKRNLTPKIRKRMSDFRKANPIKYWLGKRGKEIPAYKHGKSRVYTTGYNSPQYRIWRKSVFDRDNHTCQKCGFHGSKGYITAHHIKSFAHFPKLKYKLYNGLTLCEECHKLTDNYKGRANKK